MTRVEKNSGQWIAYKICVDGAYVGTGQTRKAALRSLHNLLS